MGPLGARFKIFIYTGCFKKGYATKFLKMKSNPYIFLSISENTDHNSI